MLLLLFVTFLCFLSASTSIFTKPLIRWLNKASKKEQALQNDISDLQTQQSQISMVDNFAIHAKLQRKINSLKMELGNISSERTTSKYVTQFSISFGAKIFLGILMLIIAITYRYVPIYVFPSNFNLYPVSSIIAYPNSTPGSVSVHMWLVICNTVARQILK